MLYSKIERCTRHISYPWGDSQLLFVLLHHKCTWYTCLVTLPFVEVPPRGMSINPGWFRTIQFMPIISGEYWSLHLLLFKMPQLGWYNDAVILMIGPHIWEGLGRHVFTQWPALLFTSGLPCSKHLFKESQSDSLSWKFALRPMELKLDRVTARSVTITTQSHIWKLPFWWKRSQET